MWITLHNLEGKLEYVNADQMVRIFCDPTINNLTQISTVDGRVFSVQEAIIEILAQISMRAT